MLFIQVLQARNLPLNTSEPRQARRISVASPYLLRVYNIRSRYGPDRFCLPYEVMQI